MKTADSADQPRVVLCTSGGLYGAAVLRRLVSADEIKVVAVILSTRNFKRDQSLISAIYFALRQFGARYLHYISLGTLVADCWGALNRGSVGAIAAAHQIPVYACDEVNGASALQALETYQCDIALSAFFNQKIGKHVLSIPKVGVLNIHPSLLPRFRGVDPVFQMQRRGEKVFGVSLHRVDLELDEGNIVRQAALPPPLSGSTLSLTLRSFDLGAELFLEAVRDRTAFGPGSPQALKGQQDCYDSWPTHEQVDEFRKRGEQLWQWSDISNHFFGSDRPNARKNRTGSRHGDD